MNKEKQIEEMARDVTHSIVWDSDGYAEVDCLATARKLHLKGYRKQSEGEWIYEHELYGKIKCSACNEEALLRYEFDEIRKGHLGYVTSPFCPNCGARMKGGAE